MAKTKEQVEEQVADLDEDARSLVRDILKADLPKPIAYEIDRVGKHIVVMDNGEVWTRTDMRHEPWLPATPIPGTAAALPEA